MLKFSWSPLTILLANIIFCAFYYNQLPERIPIHFNSSGTADGFGGPASIFGPVGVGVFVFFLLSLIQTNAFGNNDQSEADKKLLEIVHIGTQALFLYISISIICIAIYDIAILTKLLVPLVILLVCVLLYYVMRLKKNT